MSARRFDDFADLYRAAFAEPDPEIKQLLLADVKRALDRWAESEAAEIMAPKIRPSATLIPASQQVA